MINLGSLRSVNASRDQKSKNLQMIINYDVTRHFMYRTYINKNSDLKFIKSLMLSYKLLFFWFAPNVLLIRNFGRVPESYLKFAPMRLGDA